MDILFTALQVPFLAVSVFLGVYLLVLTLAALFPERRLKAGLPAQRRFAIIIPAHNEEGMIEHTLRSVRDIHYPPELFDVIVVADNCTDHTAQIARTGGAIVHERSDDARRGKGAALNWIVPRVLGRRPGYDAYVFIDADIVISPNFLDEMNRSLHQGHQVIQSSDLVLEDRTSWRVQLAAIAFALQNYVRPLGRCRLGLSVALKGTGMCFSSEAVREIHWEENSLVEDLDLALELVRREIGVHFNPHAVVFAVMPTLRSNATTQRIRWEGGRFATIREKVPGLLIEAVGKRSFRLFDAAVDTAFPPLVPFAAVAVAFLGVNALCSSLGIPGAPAFLWAWSVIIGILLAHGAVGVVLARIPPRTLLALLHLPAFLFWKIGVYGKMVRHTSETEWIRTGREEIPKTLKD